MKNKRIFLGHLLLLIFLLTLIPVSSFAIWGNESAADYKIKTANPLNGFPEPKNNYVNDYANVINDIDSKEIESLFKKMESQTGIEAVVVTINSISDYDTPNQTLESFATSLFNTWGVGNKKRNDGILILVAVKDRKCRIELGGGYDTMYNDVMKKVIDQKMIPYFKNEDYSRGIYEGAKGATDAVTNKVTWLNYYKWPIILGVLMIICIFAGISCITSGKSGWGWAFFAIAGAILLFILKILASSGSSGSGSFGGGSSFGGGASGSW